MNFKLSPEVVRPITNAPEPKEILKHCLEFINKNIFSIFSIALKSTIYTNFWTPNRSRYSISSNDWPVSQNHDFSSRFGAKLRNFNFAALENRKSELKYV